jgi:hypothetical protein
MLPRTRYARSGELSIAYLVVGSGLEFADRGVRSLRGVPGTWPVFAVVG